MFDTIVSLYSFVCNNYLSCCKINLFAIYFKLSNYVRKEELMDIRVKDIVQMKKQHPCGSKEFEILRVGMDFKIKCVGCGHEVMLPRIKCEKNIRKVFRDGVEVSEL